MNINKNIIPILSGMLLISGLYQLEIILFDWMIGQKVWYAPFYLFVLPLDIARDLFYAIIFISWFMLLIYKSVENK